MTVSAPEQFSCLLFETLCYTVIIFFLLPLFLLPRIKCSPSGEDRTAGDALWLFCPQFVLTMCRSVAWGATECTNCHAKPSRSCWADALQTGEVTGSSRTLFFSWGGYQCSADTDWQGLAADMVLLELLQTYSIRTTSMLCYKSINSALWCIQKSFWPNFKYSHLT